MPLTIECAVEILNGNPLNCTLFIGSNVFVQNDIAGELGAEWRDVVQGCIDDICKSKKLFDCADLVTTICLLGCLGCDCRREYKFVYKNR